MNEKIIEKAREFVKEKSKNPVKEYGFDPFSFHFVLSVEYSKKLCDLYDVDEETKEVAIISTWLHDIGSLVKGKKNHEVTGSKISEDKLREWNYPEKKIERVKKCILKHRKEPEHGFESIEERIVFESDCLSNFDNIFGIFRKASICENRDYEESLKRMKNKIDREWNKISDKAKEIVKNKYESLNVLLR